MKLDKSRKIGIISGIGPLAGADVLQRVFKCAASDYSAVEDADYPDVILISHGIEEVDNLATLSKLFKTEVVRAAEKLIDQGTNVVGIACNTAHAYLKYLPQPPGVKVANLLEEVAKAASVSPQNYVLISSHATRDQQLYHPYLEKYGVKFSEVDSKQQEILDKVIGYVMAYKLEEAGEALRPLIQGVAASGFTGIIAGCTELPIAISKCKDLPNLEIIESNEVLAKALTDSYYK